MSYKRKTIEHWKFDTLILTLLLILFIGLMYSSKQWSDKRWSESIVTPVSASSGGFDISPHVIETETEVTKDREDIDTWVGDYVDLYFNKPSERSEMRMIMHCLLNRESVHGNNKGYGDNGKAGGPLQFHQPTWNAYRQIMIDRGIITDTGDRHDMKQAIHTAVWAIKDGRGLAWGPILRSSKGNNYAACEVPTWY